MLDLGRLRLLRELHARGTIAAVAEALQFTPSAVSQQLAVLEREAGVRLLERAGRGVRLTDAALVLVGHAEALLDARGARRGRAGRRRGHHRRPRPDRLVPVGRVPRGASPRCSARGGGARSALRARGGGAGGVAARARARRRRPGAGRRVAAPAAPAAARRRPRGPRARPGQVVLPEGHPALAAHAARGRRWPSWPATAWTDGPPGHRLGGDDRAHLPRGSAASTPTSATASNDSVMCLALVAADRRSASCPTLVRPGEHPGRRRAVDRGDVAAPHDLHGHPRRRRRAALGPGARRGRSLRRQRLRSARVKGVIAAGHPLTAEAGARRPARGRQRGGRRGGGRADVVRGRVAAHRPRRRRLHAGAHRAARTTCSTSSSPRPGTGIGEPDPAPLRADRRGVRRGRGAALQLRPLLVRRLRHDRAAWRRRCERFGSVASATSPGPAARAAREGVEVIPMQALPVRDPRRRSCARRPRCAAHLRAGWPAAAGGRAAAPARAGRPARPARRRGARLPLRGRRGRGVQRLGAGARRPAHPRDLAAYEVIERAPARARFRGREVLTNPPPSSGGILIADALELLDRIDRPGDTRALAEVIASTNRARDEEFLDGLHERGLRRPLPRRRTCSTRWRARSPRGWAPPRTSRGDGRRRRLRHRHLLERLVLRRRRARHGHAPEQHAGRGGPQPAAASTATRRAPGCRA